MKAQELHRVLIVEDSEPDAMLLSSVFEELGFNCDINIITNGEEAIDYLNKSIGEGLALAPSLIMLDLNLPGKTGLEVLKEIKGDDCLNVIPIIIYTSSEDNLDVWSSYSMMANSYVVKGFKVEDVFEKISALCDFWFKSAKLPSADPGMFIKGDAK